MITKPVFPYHVSTFPTALDRLYHVRPPRSLGGLGGSSSPYGGVEGVASLHEGSLPLGPAFVTGTLPAGIEFDEIRIGASEEAVLALRSLTVRTGESGEE